MSSLVLSSRTGHCLFNTANRFYFSLPSAIDFANSRLNFYKSFHIHPFLFFAGLFPAFLLFFPAGRALSVFCNRSMAFFVISFKTLSPLFCNICHFLPPLFSKKIYPKVLPKPPQKLSQPLF